MEMEGLNWTGWPAGMVKFDAIGDGSCMIHALLNAFSSDYQNGLVNRRSFVRGIRDELAELLAKKADPANPYSITWYEKLARGGLKIQSQEKVEEYSLDNLQKQLRGSGMLDTIFLELISDALRKDVYILLYERKSVYLPDKLQFPLLYKNRDSIILIHSQRSGGHYDFAARYNNNGTYTTLFSPSDPLIREIRRRMGILEK